MIEALHISESGLRATQSWIDNISNNVANMHTAGFKKTGVNFLDLVNKSSESSGNHIARDDAGGIGTKISNVEIDFTEGSMKSTGRALDVAIQGRGFLEVINDDGSLLYTRLGSLNVNRDGLLTTISGLELSDQISVPPDVNSVEIRQDGILVATFADGSGELELGQLNLALIPNAGAMDYVGSGLFAVNDMSGDAMLIEPGTEGAGSFLQGFLEMSNVELVDEMTDLVLAQRAYQLNARLIQTVDQILETVNNLRR